MRELGEIIRLDDGKGVVRMDPHGGCEKCGLNGFCHATGSGKRELVLSLGGKDYKRGELVEIETAPGSVITAAFLVFIFPLILSITAYAVVSGKTVREGYPILAFVLTFVVAELMVMTIDRLFGRKQFFQPRIIKRVSSSSEKN